MSLELEDKSLVALLKKSIDNQKKYRELAEQEAGGEADNNDDVFYLYETLKDYPYLKKEIDEYEKNVKRNPA